MSCASRFYARDALANLLENYVPAGGLNPEREQEKFLQDIWELMFTMDAEKHSISSFEIDIESFETSSTRRETTGGEEGGYQGEGREEEKGQHFSNSCGEELLT